MQANQVYIDALKDEGIVIHKIKDEWVELNKVSTRKAVLADSLFLRFMDESITRIGGKFSKDFIMMLNIKLMVENPKR